MSEIKPNDVTRLKEARDYLEELSLVMCGGKNLGSYVDEFRAQGESQCTNVWSKGIIAYRCRACQTNDSSAICVDCFQNGSHWEHDYVMYHSESGGCCDCGDRAAWKESGFCNTHQRVDVLEVKVKDELLAATHDAVQYVLRELLVWVKKLNEKPAVHQSPSEQETKMEVSMAMIYLNWSLQVCAVDALRSIVCEDMMKCEIRYQTDTLRSPLDIFLECLGWMPEKIIEAETTLFLQLLYKNEFKNQFLNILKGKYEEMIMRALNDEAYMKNYKYLDTNLDRVMVQLFNDPEMTTFLIHENNLLELFIGVFSKVITCSTEGEPAVVNVELEAIKFKVYLRPQGDLRLIVSHGEIAVHMLLNQPHLFSDILDVLVKLQWINPYFREGDDIEFENSWTLAIQLEMNSMAIVFQLIARCYNNLSVGRKTLLTAATCTLRALNQHLEQAKRISEQNESGHRSKSVSLHIPLHRTLSAILQKLVLLPWDNHERGFLSALLPRGNHERDKFTEEVLRLMEHPLRILVWMTQIRAQMWRKKSEEFSRLELIYRGSFWHDQSMDMDILLIQFCTVALENMQETIFIKIAEQFNFKILATTRLIPKRDRRQSEITLLQDFMRLILLIVRERRNLGRTDLEEAQDKCLQYDVIQWLCVRDQTYSQLCRALSAAPLDHEKLNAMLDKVAIYHEPKVADRGYYQLKPEYWREFDPLFAHYYLNELEDAEDRAVKVGKLEHYWRIKAPPAAGAPYDRLSSLLHTKACHLFLLNVLDEVRYLVKENVTATAGEALGVTALQVMAVVVSDSRDNIRRTGAAKTDLSPEPQVEFSTEDIAVNIHVPIPKDSSNCGPEAVSIRQILRDLIGANHCTRLVDSVNHVLELLCLSSNENTCAASESESQGGVEFQRRLLKEQRQKAILAEFAAKQSAFMEHQDVSDDDDDFEEGSEEFPRMEDSDTVDETHGYKSGVEPAIVTVTKAVMPVPEADYVATETSTEIKECVLCRRKDHKNSSMCWIAFVQRYNFPCQVLKRGEPVSNISNVGPVPIFDKGNITDEGLDQLVALVLPDDSGHPTAIDFTAVEHVQCCGHQMHFDCFQGHMKNLMLSRNGVLGTGVVDPSKAEFACPTCRRLANVLLPDVDASLLSKRHDMHEDGKGVEETGKVWSRFWQSNKNLELAAEYFCSQMLRVQMQLPQLFFNLSRFELSKALWEGLVLNVIHCEVETRDGYVKSETASSSSAPIKLSDECTWGGDAAHWIALRELGRLAMLSNTLPGAVQGKDQMLRRLRECLGLLGTRETLPESDFASESPLNWNGISELEKIIQEIFPQNSMDSVEPQPLEAVETASDPQDCQDETVNFQENPDSNSLSCFLSVQERELEPGPLTSAASSHTKKPEESIDSNFGDSKPGGTYPSGLPDPDPVPPVLLQKHAITFENETLENKIRQGTASDSCPNQLPSLEQKQRSSQVVRERPSTWISDIFKNGVLTADPSRLLTLLLIIFNGQPDRRSLLSMVKFAYTAAILQAEIAITKLGIEGPMVESLVQRACLPFLRRAAMLFQIITKEDFRVQLGLSGTNVMQFISLQQALQLPDCTQILQRQAHVPGARETLAHQLLALHEPVSKAFTFELRKVPFKALLHRLPRVFQELLLENIHNKKQCSFCREMPKDPAICLICGALLCCGSDCCRSPSGIGECSQHAADESAGVGIFLLLRSTQLLLLRGNRTCMGLSLYLDIHGEEDLYLRRSQLLFLSDLRLKEVQRLWMTAAFDYDSYILRNSQSKPNQY